MNETPKSVHTPLPWATGKGMAFANWIYSGTTNLAYARVDHGRINETTAAANAAFIVRACNSHYQLVDALESANTLLTKAVGDIVTYRIMANKRPDPSAIAEYVDAINAIDAALSQAGGASD